MQSTELNCPHCGSTLNFGIDILAGTPVECLICMQTFTATPKAAAAPKVVTPTAPKPAPAAKVAIAAPAVVKSSLKAESTAPASKPHIASGAPPQTPPAPPPLQPMPLPRPSVKRNQAIDPNKIVLLVVAAGLLFFLTIGLALAAWKISSAFRPQSKPDDTDLTQNTPPAKEVEKKPDEPLDPNAPSEDPDWRKEKQEILLKRKDQLFNKGADLEFDKVGNVPALPKKPIPGLDPEKVNTAINKGVVFLKASQLPNGTWNNSHSVGHAALGGLTLLECGVPTNDVSVQRAAFHVRTGIANLTSTYELSLAVLFLSRLGDARDLPNIQGLALRLLNGQLDSGGWTYTCNVLTPEQMFQLFTFLRSHNAMQNPLGGNNVKLMDPLQADQKNKEDPFHRLNDMILTKDAGGHNPEFKGLAIDPKAPKGKGVPPNWLRAELQNLPVVKNQGKGKGNRVVRGGADGDNSNTQFALMALWTARRHGVPTDQALLSAYHRFETSQNANGGWGYHSNGAHNENTMTCVGLIGQAMGHGVAPEVIAFNPKNPKQVLYRPVLEDQAVQKGLTRLSAFLGEPHMDPGPKNFQAQNLYLLWSVERVAMLYDLRYINGKDWYGWGAQNLVHTQAGTGCWPVSGYPGANAPVNTCFALLFLRRSNLVQDLTNNLRLHSAIPDSPK